MTKRILFITLVSTFLVAALGVGSAWADNQSVFATAAAEVVSTTLVGPQITYTVDVKYTLHNVSTQTWTYKDVSQRTFHYSIMDVKTGQTVAEGNLQEAGAQYVSSSQSDVFALGRITFNKAPGASGLYRVFISAPLFKSVENAKLVKTPSAGTGLMTP